jgi:hypothetical protein
MKIVLAERDKYPVASGNITPEKEYGNQYRQCARTGLARHGSLSITHVCLFSGKDNINA